MVPLALLVGVILTKSVGNNASFGYRPIYYLYAKSLSNLFLEFWSPLLLNSNNNHSKRKIISFIHVEKNLGLIFDMVLPLAILKFEYIGSRLESVVKVIWYTDQNCILLKRNNRGYFWILHGRLIFNVLLIAIVLRTLKLLKWRWNNWFLKNIYIRVKVW